MELKLWKENGWIFHLKKPIEPSYLNLPTKNFYDNFYRKLFEKIFIMGAVAKILVR